MCIKYKTRAEIFWKMTEECNMKSVLTYKSISDKKIENRLHSAFLIVPNWSGKIEFCATYYIFWDTNSEKITFMSQKEKIMND